MPLQKSLIKAISRNVAVSFSESASGRHLQITARHGGYKCVRVVSLISLQANRLPPTVLADYLDGMVAELTATYHEFGSRLENRVVAKPYNQQRGKGHRQIEGIFKDEEQAC